MDVTFTAGPRTKPRIVGHHPIAQRLVDAIAAAFDRWLVAETRCFFADDDTELRIHVRFHSGWARRRSYLRSSVVRLECVGETYAFPGIAFTWEAIRLRLTWLREVTLWSGPGDAGSDARAAAAALATALGVPMVVLHADDTA